MIVRAKAPLRISFGGGGTDVSPYCDERGGAVLSATIGRYAYATIVPGGDQIKVRSIDYDVSISYGIDEDFIYNGQLDLAKAAIDHFRREYGFDGGMEIYLHNDAPPGSGLGSSSAITVALVGVLSEHLRIPHDAYAIAERAFRIEREEAGIQGGKQDHYASAFGGFNLIEFGRDSTIVNSLRVAPETVSELEYSLVFAYIGGTRFSGHIIEKQIDSFRNGDKDAVEAMDLLKELAYRMKDALLLGRITEFGALLDQSWQAKKRMAEGITTPHIDEVYSAARAAGALGGKIAGAGGGGFMFFVCDPLHRFVVQEALNRTGCELVNFAFAQEGMTTWRA